MKLSNLGKVVWENDKIACLIKEKVNKIEIFIVKKDKDGHLCPIAFVLGHNYLSIYR